MSVTCASSNETDSHIEGICNCEADDARALYPCPVFREDGEESGEEDDHRSDELHANPHPEVCHNTRIPTSNETINVLIRNRVEGVELDFRNQRLPTLSKDRIVETPAMLSPKCE